MKQLNVFVPSLLKKNRSYIAKSLILMGYNLSEYEVKIRVYIRNQSIRGCKNIEFIGLQDLDQFSLSVKYYSWVI